MSYHLIEVTDASANVHCPHCQQAVVNLANEEYIQPCKHTLFIALNIGFEYVADRFEKLLPKSVDELHEDLEQDIFKIVSAVNINDMTIVKSDLGVMDMFRYTGFSK